MHAANVRSILNRHKREELRLMMLEQNVDILGITESWMHGAVNDAEVSMIGYECLGRIGK